MSAVADKSWWARQKADADREMAANRERILRRREHRKRHPTRVGKFLREHPAVQVLLIVAELGAAHAIFGASAVQVLLLAVVIAVVTVSSIPWRRRLRREGGDV
jgi:hypothetical protein